MSFDTIKILKNDIQDSEPDEGKICVVPEFAKIVSNTKFDQLNGVIYQRIDDSTRHDSQIEQPILFVLIDIDRIYKLRNTYDINEVHGTPGQMPFLTELLPFVINYLLYGAGSKYFKLFSLAALLHETLRWILLSLLAIYNLDIHANIRKQID